MTICPRHSYSGELRSKSNESKRINFPIFSGEQIIHELLSARLCQSLFCGDLYQTALENARRHQGLRTGCVHRNETHFALMGGLPRSVFSRRSLSSSDVPFDDIPAFDFRMIDVSFVDASNSSARTTVAGLRGDLEPSGRGGDFCEDGADPLKARSDLGLNRLGHDSRSIELSALTPLPTLRYFNGEYLEHPLRVIWKLMSQRRRRRAASIEFGGSTVLHQNALRRRTVAASRFSHADRSICLSRSWRETPSERLFQLFIFFCLQRCKGRDRDDPGGARLNH